MCMGAKKPGPYHCVRWMCGTSDYTYIDQGLQGLLGLLGLFENKDRKRESVHERESVRERGDVYLGHTQWWKYEESDSKQSQQRRS